MTMNAAFGSTLHSAAASDHPDTAGNLFIRKVEQDLVPWKAPRSLTDVWKDLVTIFPTTTSKALLSFSDAKEKLSSVMKGKYKNEEEFDLALFNALRGCFKTFVSTGDNRNNPNYIFLDANENYAIGFVRNRDSTLHGHVAENSDSTSSGLSAGCRPDHHGSWLFEIVDGSLTPTDIFSVVELKESKRSCVKFSTNANGAVTGVDLRSSHGALGQVILYSISSVLLSHAKNGVLTDESMTTAIGEKTLPLAVLAGSVSATIPSKARWVSGEVLIPKACCNQYYYRVKSFGNFCPDAVDDMRSIEHALSVYLDTLLFGLRAAIHVFRDRLSDIARTPDPITGMGLMIGKQPLDLPLLATPIKRPFGDQNMVVSQAELFSGELNVYDICNPQVRDCLVFDAKREKVPVIIKASSAAVHRILILPDSAFSAFERCRSVLRSPILAAIQMNAGLITVMDDLSKQGFEILRPDFGFSMKLGSLWKGFMTLVTTVLLPIAELGVVHADIRPGFDFTANILVKDTGDGKVQLQLIDYESLVKLKAWTAPATHCGYLKNKPDWNATTFVMWQCIAVAYAWLEERDVARKDGARNPGLADVHNLQDLGTLPTWFPHSCIAYANSAENDVSSLTIVLEKLDVIFAERDLLKATFKGRGRILKELANVAMTL